MVYRCFTLLAVVVLVVGCGDHPERLFERLSPEETGVELANTIIEDDTLMGSG